MSETGGMSETEGIRLGRIGVWRSGSKLSPELAVFLEDLGYGAVWIGSAEGDLHLAEAMLEATSTLRVATGIVNIWRDDALLVAASYLRVASRYPGRFLLGIGVGHPEAIGAQYARPYRAMVDYLDVLDAEAVPVAGRALAALGPKVLTLSADRSAGAHPYLVTPKHTRRARELLGPAPLLAPEQKVVLDTDPQRARAIGRPVVRKPYLGLVNYTNNLRSLGYTDDDLADGGSDRLIDALVAHGDAAAVATRIREHLDAGADHVCLQLLTAADADSRDGYRALAAELL